MEKNLEQIKLKISSWFDKYKFRVYSSKIWAACFEIDNIELRKIIFNQMVKHFKKTTGKDKDWYVSPYISDISIDNCLYKYLHITKELSVIDTNRSCCGDNFLLQFSMFFSKNEIKNETSPRPRAKNSSGYINRFQYEYSSYSYHYSDYVHMYDEIIYASIYYNGIYNFNHFVDKNNSINRSTRIARQVYFTGESD